MKHPQHILAFNKEAFGQVDEGIVPIDMTDLTEAAERSLILIRREEAEQDERFGQVLPYVILRGDDGQVFMYRRTKMVGELRLAGMYSIGLGGHIDMADVVLKPGQRSVIDFVQTLAASVLRELDEEIIFSDNNGNQYAHTALPPSVRQKMVPDVIGLINDTSNDVGKVHYGVLMLMRVPDGLAVKTREAELETVGFISSNAYEQSMESWSKLAWEFIR